MDITQQQLEKLRDKLPSGAQRQISVSTQFSATYVNLVLGGKVDITDKNKGIITAAIEIVNKNKAENDKIIADIKNL
jgi:hypothetical protein